MSITVDANNSSTTNLVAGNSYTFTGIATDVSTQTSVSLHLYSTEAGTCYTEFSHDGSLWVDSTAHAYTAANLLVISQSVQAKYFRARVVGDSVDTTIFSLVSRLLSTVRPEETLDSATDSVSAVQSGAWTVTTQNLAAGTDSVAAYVSDSAGNAIGSVGTSLTVVEDNSALILADTTSIAAKLPSAVGQNAMADSLSVALASDQTVIETILSRNGVQNFIDVGAVVSVLGTAGQVHSIYASNTTGGHVYVKLFDAVGATLGVDNPVVTMGIPSGDARHFDLHSALFSTGIEIACTTGSALLDVATAGAGCNVTVCYS